MKPNQNTAIFKRTTTVIGGLAVLSTALAIGPPAHASPTGSTPQATAQATVCGIKIGEVTALGGLVASNYAATRPPTQTVYQWGPSGLYPAGKARLASFIDFRDANERQVLGYVTLGDAMYFSTYFASASGDLDPEAGPPTLTRVGGGWANYTAFDVSRWANSTSHRTSAYAVRNDGVLSRWTIDDNGAWRNRWSYAGLKGVKSIAVISKTATYDTLLANTVTGVLKTIRIPVSTSLRPVIKTVRSGTWQGFESLIATKCGTSGTLLLGIDKDLQKGYLYAVGHATGTSTVIQSIGLVPAIRFDSPVYFRWGVPAMDDPMNGE